MSNQIPAEIALCVEAASDKKAEEIVILDVRGLSDVTDFFFICHGASDRQVQAIVENIDATLSRELDRAPSHVEGLRRGEWVLMDYIDLVVHVFNEEKRRFYGLERLWADAPRILPEAAAPSGLRAGSTGRSSTGA